MDPHVLLTLRSPISSNRMIYFSFPENHDEDYILSPVVHNGKQFCTTDEVNKGKDANGNWISKLPVDADANGAYHIALKGLYLINNTQIKKIENEKWFQFMVEKPYLG